MTSYYLEVTVTYIPLSGDFAYISKHHTSGTCSVSHYTSHLIFCVGLWILVQSGIVNDLILFVGHCDLYFMAQ